MTRRVLVALLAAAAVAYVGCYFLAKAEYR